MTRSPEYWKRRYERAEAGRLAAISAASQRVDVAADDLQQQVDALEMVVLTRAALVNIDQDGPKLRITLTRRGQIHRIEAYAGMSMDVAALRRELLE